MRKILLSLLFSCIGLYAMGQNAVPAQGNLIPAGPHDLQGFKAAARSMQWTHWFNNRVEAANTGFQSYSWFFNTLFSDSAVKTLYSDGNGGTVLGYVGTEGIGEVFDPKANIYDTFLSRFNPYTVDSVGLPYFYNYVKDSSGRPDTLIFQFYTANSGGLIPITLSTTPSTPAHSVKYNYKTNLSTGLSSGIMYKYILGQSDSQNVQVTRAITVPTNGKTGIHLAAKDLFGYTVSYHPGFKYTPGDTVDERYTATPIKHKHSHFRYLIGNSGTKDQTGDFEESLTVPTTVRYNSANSNGWNGSFIPGFAWNKYNQILWSLFHVTTPNLGIETAGDIKGYGLGNIYPNPTHGSARLDFALAKSENVTINVYDIVGHQVATLANGVYSQGSHTIEFNTQNYKSGLYLYSITAGSYTKTMKFTVTE